MPGIVMKPKVLRRVKDRKKPPSPQKGKTRPKKNPRGSTQKMAKGGMVCRGGGAATKGTKFTRNG